MTDAETKFCPGCGAVKPRAAFGSNKARYDGLNNYCRDCIRLRNDNRGDRSGEHRRYYVKNRDQVLEKQATRKSGWSDARRASDREVQRVGANKRYKTDPMVRIKAATSVALRRVLLGEKAGRRTFDLLGYTTDDLRQHLEKRFAPGMSWDNYGEWHIDHERPVASFSFDVDPLATIKECWALENLKPMWGPDNKRKSSTWNGIHHHRKGNRHGHNSAPRECQPILG